MQAKLGVADEEFAKWKFAFINNLRQPEYLADDDVVAARFPRQTGTQGLGSQEVHALIMQAACRTQLCGAAFPCRSHNFAISLPSQVKLEVMLWQ